MRYISCILFTALTWQAQAFSVTRRQALATAGATAVGTVLWQPQSARAADKLYTPAPQSLTGQTIVITGGTTGLGLESAKRLAIGGANIIVTARTTAKGEKAVAEVQQYLQENGIDNPMVSYKLLNLDDLSAVKQVPKRWNDVKQIDVLMNNAGVMAIPERQLTVDGYERQIQTNHLGHFVLTALLQSKLSPDARIVNVSSQAFQFASKMRSDQSLWEPQPDDYSPWVQYGQTKLANILFTEELQRRSEAAGKQWTVVSLHPGAVATDLGRFIAGEEKWQQLKEGKGTFWEEFFSKTLSKFILTVPEGATTQVFLAARADQESQMDVKGQFLDKCAVQKLPPFATDPLAAEKLWSESEEKAGIKFTL